MKTLMTRMLGVMLLTLLITSAGQAQETEWSGGVNSLFTEAGNWSDGAPADFETQAIIETGPRLPVIIDENAGRIEVGAIQIGLEEGGSLSQSGGTLVIDGESIDQESGVGINATEPTRWVVRGNATIDYDSPRAAAGSGFDTDGSGKDFDVGKNVPADAVATLELLEQAQFRIADDLKVADGDFGHAQVIMSGDSMIAVGSGISVDGESTFSISGNARLITGNSSNPGDSVNGRTNEGYLTLSTSADGVSNVNVSENGTVYARTLQQRDGISTIELSDQAQFHVFDVFNFPEPSLGSATVEGSAQGPQRTTHVSQNATAETFILLSGSSVFSVDSDLEDSGWSGFALSGGNNRGGNGDGGTTIISVEDEASFRVAQDLHMTLGISDSANSTLTVVGPDAKVSIGGDLRMAIDDFDTDNPGEAILEFVITGDQQGTVEVAGTAVIENGSLVVGLDGYSPRGGESYTLLTAGDIQGGSFRDLDLEPLSGGLQWNLEFAATSINLSIAGFIGDFDGSGALDAGDIDVMTADLQNGVQNLDFDVNGDNTFDASDRTFWINEIKNTYLGDANLDGEFNSGDLVTAFSVGEYEDGVAGNSTWAEGDWDGNGDFDTADFVAAFAAGGYEQGPRAAVAVASVPEPSAACLLTIAFAALAHRRRRK